MFNVLGYNHLPFNQLVLATIPTPIAGTLLGESSVSFISSELVNSTLVGEGSIIPLLARVQRLQTGICVTGEATGFTWFNASGFNQLATRAVCYPAAYTGEGTISAAVEVFTQLVSTPVGEGTESNFLEHVQNIDSVQEGEGTLQGSLRRILGAQSVLVGEGQVVAEFASLASEALLEDSRQLTPQVIIYFPGLPVILTGDDVWGIRVLEEYHNTNEDYLAVGGISTLELELELDNREHLFDLDNQASPYFGKLLPEVKIEVNMLLTTTEGVISLPQGIYYSGYWEPSEAGSVTVVAYDQLYFRAKLPMVDIPVQKNVSLWTLLKYTLDQTGMTYSLDSRLNVPIEYGWLPVGTVWDALVLLTLAGRCNVTVERNDTLSVVQIDDLPLGGLALTGDDMIINAYTPTLIHNAYAAIDVNTALTGIEEDVELLRLSQLTVAAGTTVLSTQTFGVGPVRRVVHVVVADEEEIWVRVTKMTAWSIDMEVINNTGVAQVVDIVATGDIVSISYKSDLVATSGAVVSDKVYEVQNPLLQSAALVTGLSDQLAFWLGDVKRRIDIQSRGHPQIQLGEAITVTEERQSLIAVKTLVARNEFVYDGGSENKVECIRLEG